MKKIIKNLNIKVLLTILSLIAFQSIVFFITKFFIQEPYILNTTLDNLLPYIPQFIWIYVFWYIMLAIVPYYIAHKNIDSFYKYTITFVITTLMAGLIFVIFPNGVIRANITDTSISSKIVKIIYNLDNPAINCLPSIHCLYSFLFIFAIFDTKKNTPLWAKITVTILSILVVFSTLFIKQHVIYDAIASLIIGTTTWIVVDKFKIYRFFNKVQNNFLDKKIA